MLFRLIIEAVKGYNEYVAFKFHIISNNRWIQSLIKDVFYVYDHL